MVFNRTYILKEAVRIGDINETKKIAVLERLQSEKRLVLLVLKTLGTGTQMHIEILYS